MKIRIEFFQSLNDFGDHLQGPEWLANFITQMKQYSRDISN